MPRNPNKTRCHAPGCHNWAMRGYELCRSHRDPIFGAHRGGAPKGNRNAIRTGAHAHTLPHELIRRLAHHLVTEPDNYLEHMAWAVKKLHYRPDPCISLQILVILIRQVQPHIANNLFTRELDAYVEQFPSEARSELRTQAWQSMNHIDPIERLYLFRETIAKSSPPGKDDDNLSHSDKPGPPPTSMSTSR